MVNRIRRLIVLGLEISIVYTFNGSYTGPRVIHELFTTRRHHNSGQSSISLVTRMIL